jgi:uncharacterized membrane protein YbaN (DUF454 family)
MRYAWIALGLLLCGVGFAGIVLPLLPGTPFFLLAAVAFGRSSPRLHGWVLSLPRVGATIRDYRAGLGIPWRTKLLAVLMAGGAVSLSALALKDLALRIAALGIGAVGIGYVLAAIPTRKPERTAACDRSIP